MKSFVIGKSVLGMAIPAFQFGSSAKKRVLILGGVHGDEIEGVALCNYLVAKWSENIPLKNTEVLVVPALNIDGVLMKQRQNHRGIDLNRNLPTKDWTQEVSNPRYYPGSSAGSEPENQALVKLLQEFPADFILSMHSFERFLLNVNGNCEPIASDISKQTSYPIEESMGYPTPGCLGTYTGLEQGVPTITYELKRGASLEELIPLHAHAVETALINWEKEI